MAELIHSRTSENRLGAFLDARGLTVEQFSRQTGLDLQIARRLAGDRRLLPDLTFLEAVWRAYQTDPTDLAVYLPQPVDAAPAAALAGPAGAQVTICGAGNLGQALAGLLGARGDLRVHLFVARPERARPLRERLATGAGIQVSFRDRVVHGRPALITADPAEAVVGSGLVLLCLPSFVEDSVLARVIPHLPDGALIGAVPAAGGFDWKVRRWLRRAGKCATVFGVAVIPWMCKVIRDGEHVAVLGTKRINGQVTLPAERTEQVSDILSDVFGMPVLDLQSFLNITLNPGNQLLHPGLLYAYFRDRDGRPLPEPPLLYESITEAAAAILERLSNELLEMRAAVEVASPGLRLSAVLPLGLSIQLAYGADVLDPRTLRSTIASNRAYAGIRAPMLPVEAGWIIDRASRFFWEDVPHGLVVLRGIADLVGVATPMLDEVLVWAQRQMGREYLVDGQLTGCDLPESGAPAVYGVQRLEDLLPTGQRMSTCSMSAG